MKFTLIKDIRKDRFMRPILSFLVLFLTLYLLSDMFVKYSSFGIFPNQVFITLYGDEQQFVDAISESVFLEYWHTEIFFSMMTLFLLATIYIRVSNASTVTAISVNIMMLSSIFALVSLLLAFYGFSFMVYIYVTCFGIWHFVAVLCALDILRRFYFA